MERFTNLAISPFRTLYVVEVADAGDASGLERTEWESEFASSGARGLMFLAGLKQSALSPVVQYFKKFAESYFQSLCRSASQDSTKWISPTLPSDDDLRQAVESAPPMKGLEYLSPETLSGWWDELDVYVKKAVKDSKSDLSTYLRRLNPSWNLNGRVTFHLAENKKSADHPFAFLETFAEGKSDSGKLRHVPLADALKLSISEKDTDKLNVLLEPVRRAAEKSKFLNELLESRKIFSPQVWTIRQAYCFFSERGQARL